MFQCSSASRKFLNTGDTARVALMRGGFSALQRAENSSILKRVRWRARRRPFQCSSASRKFLNAHPDVERSAGGAVSVLFSEPKIPQLGRHYVGNVRSLGFSALQRAENSSIYKPREDRIMQYRFQCSSASRKFLNSSLPNVTLLRTKVSVLFSEPKIPQLGRCDMTLAIITQFQCSSASRKFLNL